MKILHVGISEHLGGIETYLHKIAAHIDRQEFQFDFLTYPGVTPCFYEELTAMGCRFQRVTPRRESLTKFKRDFAELLQREKYDAVHCHLVTLSFIEPVLISRKLGIPVIIHSHSGSYLGNQRAKLIHYAVRILLPREGIFRISVSQEAGKWMFGKRGSVVLNNGVDLEQFAYSQEGRNRIRQEFGIKDQRLIVHVGRFSEPKNHEFLVEVFEKLHRLEPDARLLMVGAGELQASIREKVSRLGLDDHVVFAGLRRDVPDILSAGDLFLFPSWYEGFPCSLIEAEAVGLPCLVSDSITREVGIEGLCRYKSLKDSPESWAEQIQELPGEEDREQWQSHIRGKKLDVSGDIQKLTDIYRALKG